MNVRKPLFCDFSIAANLALGRNGAIDADGPVAAQPALALSWAGGPRGSAAGSSKKRSVTTPPHSQSALKPSSVPTDSLNGSSVFLGDSCATRRGLLEKELRTFARIPRFRLVYAMSCFFGLVLYIPTMRHPRPQSFFQAERPAYHGALRSADAGPDQLLECFGFDRSAVQGYFSWPIAFRDVLIAKNMAVVCMLIPQILLISIIGVRALPASVGKVVETIVVMIIASLYWFAIGNICSVRMPRATGSRENESDVE